MTCSASPPKYPLRSRLVPGLALRGGDVLLKRYRLESLVSANAARARISAVAIETKTQVIVDVDSVDVALDGDALDELRLRLLAEARKAMLLTGPHVARVLDVGVTVDGHPFVVRENLDGDLEARSLAMVLADGTSFETTDAVDVIIDLCDALAEAHAIGLVHGSITANEVHLAMAKNGPSRVKLTELGTTTFARVMSLVGLTPATGARAPESFQRGSTIDERSDVFALGVLLYTMLAGAEPFTCETPSGMDLAVALDEPASLAGVPDALAELVDSCLAKNAEQRPKSIRALAVGLGPFSSTSRETTIDRIQARGFGPQSSPTLVVRQAFDKAEALLTDADNTAPREVIPASQLDCVIEVEKSVQDVTLPLQTHAPDAPPTPTPRPQSIPPMVMSVTPPPVAVGPLAPTLARRRSTSSVKSSLLVAACAGLALAAAVGALAGLHSRKAPAPAAAAVQPATMKEAPPPAMDLPTTTPNSLPAAVTPSSLANAPANAPAAAPAGKPRAAKAAAQPHEAAPTPAPEKIEKVEKTEKQPEPKGNDDDLRRYLDERR